MKRLTGFRLVLMVLCCVWTTVAHAEKGFILLASTIGPVDAGIVAALEEGGRCKNHDAALRSLPSGLKTGSRALNPVKDI